MIAETLIVVGGAIVLASLFVGMRIVRDMTRTHLAADEAERFRTTLLTPIQEHRRVLERRRAEHVPGLRGPTASPVLRDALLMGLHDLDEAAHRAREARAAAARRRGEWFDRKERSLNMPMDNKQPKLDGRGDPIVDDADYYVQDKRGVVGNCALWWALESKGYVCELSQAGIYKGSEVRGMRETDVPWPVDVVRASACTHVRVEPLLRAAQHRDQERIARGEASRV